MHRASALGNGSKFTPDETQHDRMASTQVAYGALNNEILGRCGGITEMSVELNPSAPCVGVLKFQRDSSLLTVSL